MNRPFPPRAKVSGITIDGATSRDLDDAISVQAQEDGILCQVHIADVDAQVPKNSAADQQAAQRLETVYRRQYNEPMLPRSLSEQRCSLLPGGDRKTLSVSWTLARDGSLAVSPHLFLSQFTSQQRWTYPQFDQALNDDNPDCLLLRIVAEHLYQLRSGEQALFGRRWDGVGYLNEEGKLLQTPFQSQMVVAEFAIAANRFVAEYARRQQIPLLFRNQTAAADQLRSPLIQQLIAIDDPQALRRCLSQALEVAEYGVRCDGHFGLALDAYCHFTSPIRRYVDLINHRLIKASLLGIAAPYSPEDLEQQATLVNRWREAAREQTHQYFKAAAKAEQDKQLEQSQNLSQLSSQAFSKLLVTACEAGKLATLADELQQRAVDGSLALIDMRWVLLRGKLPDLQAQLLTQLSPKDAVSVVVMEQGDEVLGSVEWAFESDDRGWWARATGQIQSQTMVTPWVMGSKKQSAKGNAAKAMLAGWLEQSLVPLAEAAPFEPVFLDPEPLLATSVAETTDAVSLEATSPEAVVNYIGEINTLAQKQGTDPPKYEILSNREGGFRATVIWEGACCEALGSSKKRAKTAVAKLLWEKIDVER